MSSVSGPLLYARSRRLPLVVPALAATALATAWLSARPQAPWSPLFGLPTATTGPLLAAAAVGVSLLPYADELERTAVRAWWPRRLAHLLALTALATALLALTAPSAEGFGAAATVRNTLGAVGLAALGAAALGARLSWLPSTAWLCAAFTAGPPAIHPRSDWATIATWASRPDHDPLAWATALTLFTAGATLHSTLGSRPTTP